MGHDVFISYSHRDQKVADAACARLEQAGHRCWIAPRDVGAGEWGKAIVDGIRGARVFVLIFSLHANRSPQVNREVERAVSKGIPIIPFRIENIDPSDALEYFISNQHWLDALTPPLESHLDHLTEVVGSLLGGSSPPSRASPQATARPRTKAWLAGAGVAALAVAAVGAWAFRGSIWAPDVPSAVAAPATAPGPEIAAAPQPAPAPPMPTAAAPAAGPAHLLDFSGIRTDRAPGHRVAAPPFLHEAAVPVRVTEVLPAGSRLVFVSNSEFYGGNAARPSTSENFLTLDVPGVEYSSFTLEFDVPLAELSFTVPALFPASASGIIFPAFGAIAFSASGQGVDRARRDLLRSYVDVPAQTFTLRANGSAGIVRVIFSSDPQGVAAFRALLIEQVTFVRMAE